MPGENIVINLIKLNAVIVLAVNILVSVYKNFDNDIEIQVG